MVMAANATDEKASKFYENALVRIEKKDIDGAIIQLKNALQIDRNMLPVQVLLGKALLKNGDVIGAEVALNEALRLGANRPEVVVQLALAYTAQGKQKLLFEQPQFAMAGLPPGVQLQLLLVRAAASSDLGDVKAALKAVDDARAIDPKSSAAWLAEVPIRVRAGQLREATDAAEQGLAMAPNSTDAWYQKGSILHVAGNLRSALAAYDNALRLDPQNIEARVSRAGIHIDLGQTKDAQIDVAELRRQSAAEPRAAYMQALLAERANQGDEAKAALKEVTALLDPIPMDFIRYRPQLLMINGLAHFGLNQGEKAKQYLEAFLKVQGNSPTAKVLAQLYMRDGNTDRAAEVLGTYLKAQPNDGQALSLLASALMAKGQNARAISLMQRALQTKDLPEFRTALGLGLMRSGQAGTATAQFEAALKGDPRQTDAATSLIALYLRGGQAAKAVAVAENLVKQQPGNAGFFNLLGMARIDARDLGGARAAFAEASRLDTGYVAPRLNLARIDIATQAYEAAVLKLGEILKKDEKNAEAMVEQSVIAERKGQSADALRWLQKASDLAGPKETRWGLALVDFHLRNGRAAQALEAVKKVSSKQPDDLNVLLAYAKVQLAVGDKVGIKSTLTTATRVADYNPAPQVQIALLQLAASNLGGAAYSLEKALSSQPDFMPAMALMTEVELRQGDTAKAEKRAKDITARSPKLAVGYSLVGDVAAARGQTTAALENHRKAHQLEPSSETLLKLFRALAVQDGGKPAILLAEQWLKAHPNDNAIRHSLADTYARAGSFKLAKTAYEEFLNQQPENSAVLNNLANTLLQLKDPAAIKIAEQSVAKNPNNVSAVDTLGWALFQNGQTDRALQLLRDARLREPANSEIRYHLAAALAKVGRQKEARAELDAAFKPGTPFEGSTEAVALLKTLQ